MAATKRALWGALELGLTDACKAGAAGARVDVGPSRPGRGPACVRGEARTAVGAADELAGPEARRMKFSVELPIAAPDALMTCALEIEDCGIRRVLRHRSSRSRRATGSRPAATRPLDPFVALSFAAAATRRLRLHTNCLIPAYRNPYLTAKSVATLDACSRGRVILGVAVGYLEAEFEGLGVPFAERARRLDESLWAMKAAWADELPDNIVRAAVRAAAPPADLGGRQLGRGDAARRSRTATAGARSRRRRARRRRSTPRR